MFLSLGAHPETEMFYTFNHLKVAWEKREHFTFYDTQWQLHESIKFFYDQNDVCTFDHNQLCLCLFVSSVWMLINSWCYCITLLFFSLFFVLFLRLNFLSVECHHYRTTFKISLQCLREMFLRFMWFWKVGTCIHVIKSCTYVKINMVHAVIKKLSYQLLVIMNHCWLLKTDFLLLR